MGKNNRARRAAKAKQRAQEHRLRGGRSHDGTWSNGAPPADESFVTTRELVAGLLNLAAASHRGDVGIAQQPLIDVTSRTDDPILNRVRALLAQAESTTFDKEAEAFTAKAQELMTRHAIDLAIVSARADRSEQPLTIRIPIDDPYVDAKSLLLHCVAESSRCRSVFHPAYALASVVGFGADVAATEMLFTSLLIQAQTAMQGAAGPAPAGAHARSRSFRLAFLVAYAHRIGERLAEINADVITEAEAETSRSILPVLAARSADIDSTVDEMFGSLGESRVTGGHDAVGWAIGKLGADRAQLTSGELIPG